MDKNNGKIWRNIGNWVGCVFTGGIMMPTGNIILRFSDPMDNINIYCIDPFVDDERIANLSHKDGEFLGKTNKTGFFYYEFEKRQQYLLIFQKEGFEDQKVIVYAGEKNPKSICWCGMGAPIPPPTPEPTLTPEPTPDPTPVAPPGDHKTQEQRIKELEKEIAEHETKISWLEGKVNGILNWIRGKFGDII